MTYIIAMPAGSARVDMMDLEDAIAISSSLFEPELRKKHAGRTISLSACKLTVAEIARLFTKRLQPLKFKDWQVCLTVNNCLLITDQLITN